jgi:hypothetical protein
MHRHGPQFVKHCIISCLVKRANLALFSDRNTLVSEFHAVTLNKI